MRNLTSSNTLRAFKAASRHLSVQDSVEESNVMLGAAIPRDHEQLWSDYAERILDLHHRKS